MIDPGQAEAFLALPRLAVVGASDDPRNFGRTIYGELKGRGRHVVAVHPTAATVDGDPAYPDLASVPGDLDGVIVMVGRADAAGVVRAAIARGVPRVWLFKGIGAGALSAEAERLCEEAGVEVVAGACPLMFLEPTGWAHRFHRGIRRARRAVGAPA
jgi:predicted CoA-binding protein